MSLCYANYTNQHKKHAKAKGHALRKILKIVCLEIDFGGIFTYKKQLSSANLLLNFRQN